MSEAGSRLPALRRWEEWFGIRLPEAEIVRLEVPAEGEEARWRVEFAAAGEEPARVHVAPDALVLEGDEFRRLTGRLDAENWRAALRGWRAVRIHPDGTVEELSTREE